MISIIRRDKGLVGPKGKDGPLCVQYDELNPTVMLRMAQRYLYFKESGLVEIKNNLAASIRELKLLREDWREAGCKLSQRKKVKIHATRHNTACIEPSKQRFGCGSGGQKTTYFVTLRPKDANTLLRDVKDVLLEIRLSKKNKKKQNDNK